MGPIEDAYRRSIQQGLEAARSSRGGLSRREAALRLTDGGENRLTQGDRPTIWIRLGRQLLDPMVLVLLAAAAVSSLVGEWTDALIIAVVIFANSLLGVYQEGKAERAVEALSRMNAPQALVRREGHTQRIHASQLVVGDIVLLNAGDTVPADLRLLDGMELRVDQSSLTGESQPVEKDPHWLPDPASASPVAPADRRNMVYMGSPVLWGRAEGLVTAIGDDTQTGRIAGLLRDTDSSQTPLQKRLAELSRILSLGVLGICLLIFLITLVTAADHSLATLIDALLLAVSLAVAAIPEGLVVVVTLVLALGMNAISRRGGMIRRLNAVETLGATSVICSDKTGTLTQNRMSVVGSWGLCREGLLAAALCNALPEDWGEPGSVEKPAPSFGAPGRSRNQLEPPPIGDPTEVALAVYAQERGMERGTLLQETTLLQELPFDSSRKRMSTLHRIAGRRERLLLAKGAPETLLPCCTQAAGPGNRVRTLTPADRRAILDQNQEMAGQGLRVLALAYRYPSPDQPLAEEDLVFAGLVGLADPPRPEVKQAVAAARQAGIRTVMVSGDNLETATAIGAELGIWQPGDLRLTGGELDALSDTELVEVLPKTTILARVKPEDKLRIVRGWQSLGQVTAMTGDGVNDAPALKAADIGVGMGRCGSEVSKGVSALVLADDNFSTILAAVAEGRRIYENIRKALQFLLASNLAEVLVIFLATLLGQQIFLPIHLLWINLVTDCFPAVALGTEPLEPAAMGRPPRPAGESVFSRGLGRDVVLQGLLLSILTLAAFFLGRSSGPEQAMTMAFLTLSLGELAHAWNMRSRTASIFTLSKGNRLLSLATLVSLCLGLALVYLPPLAAAFRLTSLPLDQLLLALALALCIVPLVELEKRLLAGAKDQKQASRRSLGAKS